ncbi:MAG TPA: S-layer homology domain-containing protein [Mobilitalea sp.]|nr:S-layer homology domain-containing protein [Mobilitalea sp.]
MRKKAGRNIRENLRNDIRKDVRNDVRKDIRKNIGEKVIALITGLVLLVLSVPAVAPTQEAVAASKYIKVEEFIKYLVEEMQYPIYKDTEDRYIDAAIQAGILKEGDFKDYSAYLIRTDCVVLANRAEKRMYGAYGYTEEVYEFLKGCEYFKGRLFYNVKGELFPKGETSDSYSAEQFLEEEVLPRITPCFKFENGLRVWYWIDTNDDGSTKAEYIEIGYPSSDPYNEIAIEPFEEDHYLIQAWKKIIDGDRRVKAVYDLRISDLDKIEKSKRQDVAEIVAKGIIKGYSNGMYVQSREFRGSKKITVSGAKSVVALVLDKYIRPQLSPDGQLIRTENLPKNSYEYPYILECFPNDFYEMRYDYVWMNSYKDGTMEKSTYDYPAELGNEGLLKSYEKHHSLGMKPYEYFDTIMEKAKQYLDCTFNVDYRTVDKEWIEKAADSYMPYGGTSIYDHIDEYLDAMKKNHVIVESSLISLEPSTLYRHETTFYVRAYVRYRISADSIDVEEDNELIFGSKYSTRLIDLKNGVWTYGYYDIDFGCSNINNSIYMEFGVDPFVGISDSIYKGYK